MIVIETKCVFNEHDFIFVTDAMNSTFLMFSKLILYVLFSRWFQVLACNFAGAHTVFDWLFLEFLSNIFI